MADNAASYTYIAEINWWKLRDSFKRKFPSSVSVAYVTTTLEIKSGTAKSDVITPLKKIELIDENGVPTALANDWRDDLKYPTVCQHIIDSCYPEEVKDVYSDASQAIGKLVNWFMHSTLVGKSTAAKYAKFYQLLLRADPNEQSIKPKAAPKQPTNKTVASSRKRTNMSASNGEATAQIDTPAIPGDPNGSQQGGTRQQMSLSPLPQLHINIQLHISPESSAGQIDKIFESIARHLKSFAEKDD
jgi:hypothetical protein